MRPHDHERIAPIGFHDQKVSAIKPVIEFAESVAPALHFHAAIDAEQRHAHIAAEAAASGAT